MAKTEYLKIKNMNAINRPTANEYPEFYHTYVQKVPEGNVIDFLRKQMEDIVNTFSQLEESKAEWAYADGKWTMKELFCHLIDAERIFAYRALCFARGEKNALPGFEENDYAKNCNANQRELTNLIGEFYHVRKSNIELFSTFSDETSCAIGNANGKPISVRAIIYSIAGHADHHMNVLKERYLNVNN
jgi:hypothetical protein